MSKSFSRILAQSKLLILAAVLAVGISYVSAAGSWTAPTAVPPGNNIDTPLNVGSNAQTKNGDLAVNAFLAALNAQFNGNVTIGSSGSSASLVIPNSAAVGSVLLSSDASGTAKWVATSTLGLQTAATGLGIGQSWVTFSSSTRQLNTVYTNTTGKPIMVNVNLANDTNPTVLYMDVNGVTIYGAAAVDYSNVSIMGIVPAGATYKTYLQHGSAIVTNGNPAIKWVELR